MDGVYDIMPLVCRICGELINNTVENASRHLREKHPIFALTGPTMNMIHVLFDTKTSKDLNHE